MMYFIRLELPDFLIHGLQHALKLLMRTHANSEIRLNKAIVHPNKPVAYRVVPLPDFGGRTNFSEVILTIPLKAIPPTWETMKYEGLVILPDSKEEVECVELVSQLRSRGSIVPDPPGDIKWFIPIPRIGSGHTLQIRVDGVLLSEGTDYTVDPSCRNVSFVSPPRKGSTIDFRIVPPEGDGEVC